MKLLAFVSIPGTGTYPSKAQTSGVPLGLLPQSVWARSAEDKGKSRNGRKRPPEDKESREWTDCLTVLEREWPANRRCVVIGDREADLYPLFAAPCPDTTDLLVRAAYNRRIDAEVHTLLAWHPTPPRYCRNMETAPPFSNLWVTTRQQRTRTHSHYFVPNQI